MSRTTRTRYSALVLALVAGLTLAAPTEAATKDPSFETSGSCTEVVTRVLIDADRARAELPPGFEISPAEGGKAQLQVFAEECETSVDGGDPSRSVVGGIGIILDAAQSRGGCGNYALLWTDGRNGDSARAHRRIGWNLEVVRDSSFSLEKVAGVGATADAAVPSDQAPFEIHATGTDTPPAGAELTSVHCHLGPRGLARGTFLHKDFQTGGMAGEVVFGDGELWARLGAESQTVPVALFRFTWTGTTELVPEEET